MLERWARRTHLVGFCSLDGLAQGPAITHHVGPPYVLESSGDGTSGPNMWIRKDSITDEDRVINLGGKNAAKFGAGDRMVIHTPSGGG
jgi:N-methylhydantoinase B/oxoprolinase/acetone carboxylase alpha subunit